MVVWPVNSCSWLSPSLIILPLAFQVAASILRSLSSPPRAFMALSRMAVASVSSADTVLPRPQIETVTSNGTRNRCIGAPPWVVAGKSVSVTGRTPV